MDSFFFFIQTSSRPISTRSRVPPNITAYLTMDGRLLYVDGVFIYCLLPLISHPSLPAELPCGPHRRRKEAVEIVLFMAILHLGWNSQLHQKNPWSKCQTEKVSFFFFFVLWLLRKQHTLTDAWKEWGLRTQRGRHVSSGVLLWG